MTVKFYYKIKKAKTCCFQTILYLYDIDENVQKKHELRNGMHQNSVKEILAR